MDTFETLSQHGVTYVRLFTNPEVIGEVCSVADRCYEGPWVAVEVAPPSPIPEPEVWLLLLLGLCFLRRKHV